MRKARSLPDRMKRMPMETYSAISFGS
jgi:hypothetical protein